MRITDREYNRLRVLRALRRAEPVGRTDLAALSGLDGGTITEISGSLLARGLIQEEKVSTGKRGRPQLHLRLNPQGAHAVAAYIGIAGDLVCEIVDLRGDQVFLTSRPMGKLNALSEWAETIAALIADAIRASGFDKTHILRAGIALPAVIDSGRGVVHWVQTFEAKPYPVATLIEELLGIPVTIDNNINVLARAEHWFGEHADADNFSLFNLGYGISAAHYANGILSTGAHGLNSEMGHCKMVAEDGLVCSCGAKGCLDAYCSIVGLVRQGRRVSSDCVSEASQIAVALAELAEQARLGSTEVQRIFERASLYLGMALANHINSFDPGRIVVLCEHPDTLAICAQALKYIDPNCLPPMQGITSIEFREFEADLYRKGAAALVLEQLYKTL